LERVIAGAKCANADTVTEKGEGGKSGSVWVGVV
jgi:hypothetical protein